MKVWARYAMPVMVLVDEHEDTIERVVMVPGERYLRHEDDDAAEGISCRRRAANSIIDRDLGRHADAPELDEHGNPWPSVQ